MRRLMRCCERAWVNTKDGQRVRLRLLRGFQNSLTPEELALTLTDMLVYWKLHPTDSAPTPSTTSLVDLTALLSSTVPLEESYMILLELVGSFLRALESIDEKKSDLITQFLQKRMDIARPQHIENLYAYFIERLKRKETSRCNAM